MAQFRPTTKLSISLFCHISSKQKVCCLCQVKKIKGFVLGIYAARQFAIFSKVPLQLKPICFFCLKIVSSGLLILFMQPK